MKRRESLKALALTAISSGVLVQSCGTEQKQASASESTPVLGPDRQPAEIARDAKIVAERFFDDHEMNTIKVLIDIIIPKDEVSGSATDAGVHEFIEFIAKDMPRHQTPLRGGLKWLDSQCLRQHNRVFVDCSSAEQLKFIDAIAYPSSAKPEMKQGVAFFNLLRDLTATGFFTSEMGLKDLGYVGNKPNQWDGVPQEVLDQYGLSYDERTLKESVRWDTES